MVGQPEDAPAEQHVTIRFLPHPDAPAGKLPDVPDAPISVPSRLGRGGLSTLCNHLLSDGEESATSKIPFDFVVGGLMLRTPLSAACDRLRHSRETVLVVYYALARADPTPAMSADAEEWVSSLSICDPCGADGAPGSQCGFAAASTFEGVVRIYDVSALAERRPGSSGGAGGSRSSKSSKRAKAADGGGDNNDNGDAGVDALSTIQAHDDAVTAVSWVHPGTTLLTAGMDGTVRTWHAEGGCLSATGGFARVAEWEGHHCPVQGLAVSPNAAIAATGGWDGTLRLWRVARPEECAEAHALHVKQSAGSKRGRGVKRGAAAGDDADGKELAANGHAALSVFTGHAQRCDAVSWADLPVLHSASWDHTVRRWDAETGVNVASLSTGVAALCVAGGGHAGLVASGHSDFRVRLWDPREGHSAPLPALTSHRGWVTSVAWRHDSGAGHELASASYDGSVKVWDVRASVPLHTIEAHAGERAMAVAWCRTEGVVVSGGTDSMVRAARVEF